MLSSIIRSDINGLSFSHAEDEDLASVLRLILEDDHLREKLSLGAKRTVEDEATSAGMVVSFAEALAFASGRSGY